MLFAYCCRTRALTTRCLFALSGFFAAFFLISSAVLADTRGVAAFDQFVQGLEKLGLSVELGRAEYDPGSDVIIVEDFKTSLLWEVGYKGTGAPLEPSLTIEYLAAIHAPKLSLKGFSVNGGVYEADSWRFPANVTFEFRQVFPGTTRIVSHGKITDLESADLKLALPPETAHNSGWHTLWSVVLNSSASRISYRSMSAETESHSTVSGTDHRFRSGSSRTENGLIINAMAGHIAHIVIGVAEETSVIEGRGPVPDLETHWTRGYVAAQDVNLRAYWRLFDPEVQVDHSRMTVIGAAEIENLGWVSSTQDKQRHLVDLGRIAVRDVAVSKQSNQMEDMMSPRVQSIGQSFTGFFDLARSLSVASFDVAGISVELPIPESDAHELYEAAHVTVNNLSSDGLERLQIVDYRYENSGGKRAIEVEDARIGNVVFADFASMKETLYQTLMEFLIFQKRPFEIAKMLSPRQIDIHVDGVVSTDKNGYQYLLDDTHIRLTSDAPPLPTSVYLKATFGSPIAPYEEFRDHELFTYLDIDRLTSTFVANMAWDKTTETLVLTELTVSFRDLFEIGLSGRLENLSRDLFDAPLDQAVGAILSAELAEAETFIRDAGGLRTFAENVAKETGLSETEVYDIYREDRIEMAQQLNNDAFSELVREAISKFPDKSSKLMMRAQPAEPVSIAQIYGSLSIPQILPELLNLDVKASD